MLQVSLDRKPRRRVFVSDFFDFSIFVDAAEKDIRQWYLERFKTLQKTAFTDPNSYFHKYASYSDEELLRFANEVWEEINLPNLERNILPTRFRADLILKERAPLCTGGADPEDLITAADWRSSGLSLQTPLG